MRLGSHLSAEHRARISRGLKGRIFSAEHRANLSRATKGKTKLRTVATPRKTHCARGHELTPDNAYIRTNGHRSCKTCHKVAGAKKHLKTTYGLSSEAFGAMKQAQAHRCLICDQPFVEGDKQLKPVVDHDHRCCPGSRTCGGCVRGLLHDKCNRAIGQFDDDPVTLRKAAEYLERKAV